VWKRSKVTRGQMAFAEAYNDWTRGQGGLASVVGRIGAALSDKRPYHEPAEGPGGE
jgi:hypothetical protein